MACPVVPALSLAEAVYAAPFPWRGVAVPNMLDFDHLDQDTQNTIDALNKIGDELASLFGFQVDNVRNQAEHLTILVSTGFPVLRKVGGSHSWGPRST
jgi:hypothetical protein